MKLYFYESHLGGIYVSQRDDLDRIICPRCGDSDIMLTSCDSDEDTEEFEELFYAFCELLKYRMNRKEFDSICKQLESMGFYIEWGRDLFIDLCSGIAR